jgi:hypothetical protein
MRLRLKSCIRTVHIVIEMGRLIWLHQTSLVIVSDDRNLYTICTHVDLERVAMAYMIRYLAFLSPTMTSSHPPIPINLVKPIPCRPLLPIHPPNDPLNYPSLPSKPRKPGFSTPFSLSTHIFPAAHLRRGPHLPVPNIPPRNVPKHEQESALNALHETFYQYWNDPSIKNGEHKGILWNVVNRYVRNGLKESTSTGITLFFAHGCGYTREVRLRKASKT